MRADQEGPTVLLDLPWLIGMLECRPLVWGVWEWRDPYTGWTGLAPDLPGCADAVDKAMRQ